MEREERKHVIVNLEGGRERSGKACYHKRKPYIFEEKNRLTFLIEIPFDDDVILAVKEEVGSARLTHRCIDIAAIAIAIRVFRERSRSWL